MRIFDRILRGSPAIISLATGQRRLFDEFKNELQSSIDYISAQGEGYVVRTLSGDSVPKDDWLASATTEMAVLDAHIGDLDQYTA